MDFSDILNSLNGLLAAKQGQQSSQYGSNLALQQSALDQQNSQFGQNLGFQQQQLGQQGNEFNANLGFQQQQLGQQGSQFNSNLALQMLQQQQANQLAQQDFGLKSQGQQFDEGLQNRMNVTPGSGTWYAMQQFQGDQNPNSISNLLLKKRLGLSGPDQSQVNLTPASNLWRLY